VRRRRVPRPAAALALVATVAALLVGCVGNPSGDADWLAKQPGVASARVVQEATQLITHYGAVRGELEPGLSDAALRRLADALSERQRSQGSTTIYYLGMHRVDFGVSTDRTRNAGIVEAWRTAVGLPAVLNGLVKPLKAKVLASLVTLRSDVFPVLDALQALPVQREVGGYATKKEAQTGVSASHAVTVEQPPTCVPDPADLAFARTVPARTDVIGARLDLCRELRFVAPSNAPIAPVAGPLRDDILAARPTLPTTLVANQWAPDGYLWHIALVPGAPDAFPVTTALQRPDLQFTLDQHGALQLYDFDDDVPVADMVAAVSAAPAAASVSGFELYGSDGTVRGPVGALPALLDEVHALNALQWVEKASLSPTTASVEVRGPTGGGSLVGPWRTVAAELRANGIANRYQLVVTYYVDSVVIRDGVAVVGRSAESAGNPLQAFADAWNGVDPSASPGPTASVSPPAP
jgi:hypothetical protein